MIASCVDLREPPRHRVDAATVATSRRWRGAARSLAALAVHRRGGGHGRRRGPAAPDGVFFFRVRHGRRAERVGRGAAARREAREAGRRAVAQVPLDGVVLELAVACVETNQ